MIGFYDYTVVLTYLGLLSSVFGMTRAIHGDYKIAIICLAISGFCDCFDGRVARTKRNRTKDQKNFGIQLDSLSDVVCFGALPALICYLLGMRSFFGVTILFAYVIAAVIRLAYFNVLEGKRQETEEGGGKIYHGLPVTSISVILPVTFLLKFILPELYFLIVLHVVMLAIAILFVVDFKFRKPSMTVIIIMIVCVAAALVLIFLFIHDTMPLPADDPLMNFLLKGIST